MKYFTPELFLQFNSEDDDLADRASDAWEVAVRSYRSGLKKSVLENASQGIRRLAEEACFHDAEILGQRSYQFNLPLFLSARAFFSPISAVPNAALAVQSSQVECFCLLLQNDHRFIAINYLVWKRQSRAEFQGPWPFSKDKVHWLYDEVSLSPEYPFCYTHEILLSNGTILTIPFYDVDYIEGDSRDALLKAGHKLGGIRAD